MHVDFFVFQDAAFHLSLDIRRDVVSGQDIPTIELMDKSINEYRPNTCAPVLASCADDSSGGRARACTTAEPVHARTRNFFRISKLALLVSAWSAVKQDHNQGSRTMSSACGKYTWVYHGE